MKYWKAGIMVPMKRDKKISQEKNDGKWDVGKMS
jgi:hypothetical protein